MTWYAIYVVATGRRISEGAQTPPVSVLRGRGLERKAFDRRPVRGSTWDPVALEYVPPAVPAKSWRRPIDFLDEFTLQERQNIRAREATDPLIADWLFRLEHAEGPIAADYEAVPAGLDHLVAQGILTPARRTEILS